ncbi:YibE/F family protein [Fructobacillus sp. M1-13]|uniref:YibE/F family protein n=1 Tax=Fructobacillus papyriferae TaxID=2713171 RepID=A0ABS5QQD3_9LACO|nr:YibE/F family protein [Fructobacillus papyriferae]MBS9335042.1 YibE/F family protein [Fructobacillus papyriferae]MCD2159472.1 YibE/F family protein [Fructobacillus papyriferae]
MKKNWQKILFIFSLTLFCFLVGRFDSSFYQQPVGEVLSSKTVSSDQSTDEHGNQDESHSQKLKVKLLNRNEKVVSIENRYLDSKAESERYQKYDQILLNHRNKQYQIDMPKRDSLLFALLGLLASGLYLSMSKKKFSFLFLSLLVNAGLFLAVIIWDASARSLPVLAVFAVLAVLLSALALYFVLGHGKQALITWLATCLSTMLALFVMAVVIFLTGAKGVHFETMSYVTQVPEPIFYAQAVIGVLGAVMDESGDIVAGLFGLHREHADRAWSEYWTSGLSVGREILGTLTNVLFMIFIAETLPMVILMLQNGNTWSYILDQTMNLGILQTVVSALGIVWSVPVTAFLTASILTKRKGAKA